MLFHLLISSHLNKPNFFYTITKLIYTLDVRTDLERSALGSNGYYPGSVHIPSSDLEKRMPNEYPDKNIRILAYCNSGQRARMATEKLHKLGYKHAVYISNTYLSLY
jgi:rhodanese-related sulfurtransferase